MHDAKKTATNASRHNGKNSWSRMHTKLLQWTSEAVPANDQQPQVHFQNDRHFHKVAIDIPSPDSIGMMVAK